MQREEEIATWNANNRSDLLEPYQYLPRGLEPTMAPTPFEFKNPTLRLMDEARA